MKNVCTHMSCQLQTHKIYSKHANFKSQNSNNTKHTLPKILADWFVLNTQKLWGIPKRNSSRHALSAIICMSKSKNMSRLAWFKTVSFQKWVFYFIYYLFVFQSFFYTYTHLKLRNHHKEMFKQASAVYKFFCWWKLLKIWIVHIFKQLKI